MSKPRDALAFCLANSADVAALMELEQKPKDVDESHWGKFQRVVDLANEEIAELLMRCRDAAQDGLGDSVIALGNGAQRKTIALDWDAWREFKAPGKGKKGAFGYFGATFELLGDIAEVTGYIRPKTSEASLREALKLKHGDGARGYTTETGIVCVQALKPDTDLAGVVSLFREAFESVKQPLRGYLLD